MEESVVVGVVLFVVLFSWAAFQRRLIYVPYTGAVPVGGHHPRGCARRTAHDK
jgi:hypothetical protein